MNISQNTVLSAADYDKIDGRAAFSGAKKALTLGLETKDDQKAQVVAKIWEGEDDETLAPGAGLKLHQILDLAIFACQGLVYFREAYRMPKLYDPEKPGVARIGLQGGVMPVSVCTANPQLDDDIQRFAQALSEDGELTGERLRVLGRLLEEME